MEIPGRWLHRTASLLVLLVWPLIWLGGLVTTFDAGMAVPDWPGTYGYNMFLYPLETWLYGPFDLLIEHGHRLLGSTVGMVAIAAVLLAWQSEPRRWVMWMASGVLLAVIAQGLLGGMRVVLDARTLAMIHGCFASACFALGTALAVVTSRWWWLMGPGASNDGVSNRGGNSNGLSGRGVQSPHRGVRPATVWLSGFLLIACFVQVLLGAQLRHLHADTSPWLFRHLVEAHVAIAGLVLLLSLVVGGRLWRCGEIALSRPGKWLIGLVLVQIGLGVCTWVVNYGVVVNSEGWVWASGYVIVSKGYVESWIVTGHVATGALLVSCSVMIWLRAFRIAEHSDEDVVNSARAGVRQVAS